MLPLHSPGSAGCSCGKVDCHSIGKHPRTSQGLLDASADLTVVESWWRAWPNANVGLRTGVWADVLDLDSQDAVREFEALVRGAGVDLKLLPSVFTAKGLHFYFQTTKGQNLVGFRSGWDWRGEGGYVVAPPSRHATGGLYEWRTSIDGALPTAPEFLLQLLKQKRRTEVPAGDPIPAGRRNAALASMAGTMRHRGMSQAAIAAALLAENRMRCQPPLDDGEVRHIAASVGRYEPEATRREHSDNHRQGGERIRVPAPSDPMAVARAVLPKIWPGDPPRLVHWRGSFHRWVGSYWEEMPDLAVRDDLYQLLEQAEYYVGKDADTGELVYQLWKPTKSRMANVEAALQAVVPLDDLVDDRTWIRYDRRWLLGPHGTAFPAVVDLTSSLLPVTDGLLDLQTRTLLPPTPQFLNLSALPFELAGLLTRATAGNAVPCVPTPHWDSFLGSLWPDDPESVALLQEWFGYVLSGDIRQHKILVMVGPPRSGKGTLGHVLEALVGPRHTAGPTMSGLAQHFGLSSLIGKTLAVVADARFTGHDLMVTVERLLTISGADYIDIPRKFKSDWHGQLGVRFTFLSNELPRLPDVSGAIATRFLMLQLAESWLGREDLGLEERLMGELPGILLWALDGLDRLRARGHFVEPTSTRDAVRALMESTSTIKSFVADRCEVGGNFEAATVEVFESWREWCELNGIDHPGTAQRLGHDLRAALPRLTRRQRGSSHSGAKKPMYVGLRLRAAGDPEPPAVEDEPSASQVPLEFES